MGFYDNKSIMNMIKVSAVVLLMSFVLLIVAIVKYEPPRKSMYYAPGGKDITVNEIKHKLSAIGELSTYSYEYEGEAEMEYDRDWVVLNFLTDTEIDIEYRGVIKAGISIDQVGIEVDNELMIIFISLPRPQILSNEIEMTAYDADVDVFGKVDGDDASTLLEAAKMDELDRAIADGLLVEASTNAEQIITDLLSVYDDYEIRFLFTDREIREEMQ